MKKLIDRMNALINGLNGMYRYACENDYDGSIDDVRDMGQAIEDAGDLLGGFITGNFEDCEVDEALEMLEYWGF